MENTKFHTDANFVNAIPSQISTNYDKYDTASQLLCAIVFAQL